MWGQSLTELFQKGGIVMWPLLFCSVVALAIILERSVLLFWLRADFRAFVDRFGPLLRASEFGEAKRQLSGLRSPLSHVVGVYLSHVDSPARLREEVLGREASQQISRLERRVSWLGAVGQLATLLGLLGTVTGLVAAFHQVELRAGQVQPGDLAAGIWEALLTTVFGLTIAVPSMAAYHLFEARAGAAALHIEWLISYLDEWLGRKPE